MGKRGPVNWILISWSIVWLFAAGCSPTKPTGNGATSSVQPVTPEKTKVVVLRLENSTRRGRSDKSTGEDRLFGNGIRTQIINALEQSGRFTVVANTGPRQVLQRELLDSTGYLPGPVRERLGSLGDAELLVAGVLTTYQLSKESKKAGIEADLLFRQSQVETTGVGDAVNVAKRAFESLRPSGADRVALELWLFDARSGRRLAVSRIDGNASDTSETLATPMQQAVRGSAAKAATWLTDTQAAYRAGTLVPPAPVEVETKKAAIVEPKPQKVGKVRRPKQPSAPTLPEEKIEGAAEAEALPPPPVTKAQPAKASEVQNDDWGSQASQPTKKVEKAPAQNAEEWGEQ